MAWDRDQLQAPANMIMNAGCTEGGLFFDKLSFPTRTLVSLVDKCVNSNF